ncbi:hypothetical protein M0R45_009407 [Rubus argutus]|uniref:Uncharacterized protein n=1 Tax=Rubus argutus TaxID=59490 RepID=A0AAW1Y5Y4_RUBAR
MPSKPFKPNHPSQPSSSHQAQKSKLVAAMNSTPLASPHRNPSIKSAPAENLKPPKIPNQRQRPKIDPAQAGTTAAHLHFWRPPRHHLSLSTPLLPEEKGVEKR